MDTEYIIYGTDEEAQRGFSDFVFKVRESSPYIRDYAKLAKIDVANKSVLFPMDRTVRFIKDNSYAL